MDLAEGLRAAPPIRWGILGPGGIAAAFTEDLLRETRSTVVAVGSRSQERADRFAAAVGAQRAHASYEALVADPDVDVVYVASPHSQHHEHALLAIAAGKHVLIEKAFTRNSTEARAVLEAARGAGVFCMEAMWTRFLPHVAAMHAVIDRGEIGELVGVIADHGQNMRHHPPTHRLHDPQLAGGALLDLGVYPIAFAHDLLGAPDRIAAIGSLTTTGVDGQASIALGFGSVQQASLHTTLWARTATTAVVFGSAGRIELATDFYRPTSFTVVRDDGERWTHHGHVEGGLQFEAAEVARCVVEGRTQSARMTWQDTLDVMATMDEVRRQVGVRYPGE
ncbi:MAG: Gfo/Idh/MocA family oxidoreductase [Candidatus Nanopelagicales bacterium]|jgi:predicted dehydrogenase|nr:Gfo/Idh/MocA family oxidoreductase [Candidatus Nanopelagicales bacterium]